jgi:hypothetical protein
MYLISNVFLGKFQFLTWMYDHIFKETNNNKKKKQQNTMKYLYFANKSKLGIEIFNEKDGILITF